MLSSAASLLTTFCFGYALLAIIFSAQWTVSRSQSPTTTNETGLLSDIWTSLTTVGKTASCPGECVHAITSIFCDHVLEEIQCGETFLRCCVQQSTLSEAVVPVESEPPTIITDSESTIPTTTAATATAPVITTTSESFSIISNNHNSSTSIQVVTETPNTNIPSSVFTTQEIPTTTTAAATTTTADSIDLYYTNKLSLMNETYQNESSSSKNNSPALCPGNCVKLSSNSYCARADRNAYCESDDEECCLESESAIDTMTKNLIKLVQQSVALNETKNIGSELNALATTHFESTTVSSLPPCDGTCVVPLFSILCDEIDSNQFCPNGGYCCVNREPTTAAPQIAPCDGTCIPVILSGMCNKPYELVLKTLDCGSGTICCADRKLNEDNDINKDQSTIDTDQPMIYPEINNRPTYIQSKPQIRPINPSQIIPPNFVNQFGGYKPPMPNKFVPNKPMPIPSMHPINPPQNQIQFPHRNKPPAINPDGHHSMLNPTYHQPPIQSPDSGYLPTIKPVPGDSSNSKPRPSSDNSDHSHPKPIDDIKHNQPDKQLYNKNYINKELFPCPGSCINPMFKFTCFGGNSIYSGFYCSKSQVCCAPMTEIEKFESFLKSTAVAQTSPNPVNNPISVPMNPITPEPSISEISPHICGMKGTRRNMRIVGGSDSYPGEWCWQIALVNQQNKYICGGALIGRQWVLTAAHCISNFVRKNEPIFARAGDYDLTRNNRLAKTQKVVTTYIHHNHNIQTLDNDIALLKLQSPIELNGNICLVCLPTRNTKRDPGKRCTVTGYGFQQESGPIALRIREASVPIVEDQQCTTRINSVTEKLFILPASSFCAGGEGGNDACQGDGGSGLVCDSDGFYELTGLVSWGFGCGRNGVPGVYVKVSNFVGWINQIVSTNGN